MTERTTLLHFLNAQRRSVVAIVAGLSDADAHRSVVPSGWSPLELIVHIAGAERHWFAFALGGDRAPEPLRAAAPETLADALDQYAAEIERSDRLLAGFALDDPPTETPVELPGEIRTARDVVLHMIEETARHAGHLDIGRELIDGRTGLGPR